MRTQRTKSLENLNQLEELIDFLPITQTVMRHAAKPWATSRRQGIPTANEKN